MPEICRFFGIIIRMYFDDHAPPHFHAEYNEFEIQVQIEPLTILKGKFPPRALGFVLEWASKHQQDLMNAWKAGQETGRFQKITPLE